MKKITIISFASDTHVVDSYHSIISYLKEKYDVCHIGITSELWYKGTGFAKNQYESYGYEAFYLPRISNNKTQITFDPNSSTEINNSIPSINSFIKNLIINNNPNIFLFANEEFLPLFVYNIFEEFNIKSILLEHGYGYSLNYLKEPKKRFTSLVVSIKKIIKQILKIDSACDNRKKLNLQDLKIEEFDIKPFGKNGNYYIATFSEFTFNLLKRNKIAKKRLYKTGYPYIDKIVNLSSKEITKKENEKRKKILFVSSGWGSGGGEDVKIAINFYNSIIKLASFLQNNYDIFLRLKPNEDLNLFLDSDILTKIENLKIQYDDNSLPSYESINNYDMLIGDSSMVLLEAIILKKPFIVLKYNNNKDILYYFNKYIMKKINPTTIDGNNFSDKINDSFKPSYLRKLYKNLKQHQKYLFNSIDGNSGKRISQLIEMILKQN